MPAPKKAQWLHQLDISESQHTDTGPALRRTHHGNENGWGEEGRLKGLADVDGTVVEVQVLDFPRAEQVREVTCSLGFVLKKVGTLREFFFYFYVLGKCKKGGEGRSRI